MMTGRDKQVLPSFAKREWLTYKGARRAAQNSDITTSTMRNDQRTMAIMMATIIQITQKKTKSNT